MVWSWYEVGRNLLLGLEDRQIDVQWDRQTHTVQCRQVHFCSDSVRCWTPEVLTAQAISTTLQVAHRLTSTVTVAQMSNKFHIFIEPVDYQPCSEKTPNRPQLEAKCVQKGILVQALKLCTGRTAHSASKRIAMLFLDHGTRRGWGVSVTPRPFFLPPGKARYQLYRRLGKSQGRSGQMRKISPSPGFDPRTAQPVAQSLYRLSYWAHTAWSSWIKNYVQTS